MPRRNNRLRTIRHHRPRNSMTRTTRSSRNPPTIHQYDLPNESLFISPSYALGQLNQRKLHYLQDIWSSLLATLHRQDAVEILGNDILVEFLQYNDLIDFGETVEEHLLYINQNVSELKRLISRHTHITNDQKQRLIRYLDAVILLANRVELIR